MVPEYIKTFLALIRHGSNVNSYKLVWAKAIVEISSEHPDIKIITLQEIAKKIFKYYWNQTIYFNLTQGNNPNKRPEFVQIVRNKIEEYYNSIGERKPIHFEKIETEISIDLDKFAGILKKDVSWRFLRLGNETFQVYKYERGDNKIEISESKLLAEFSDILHESINYKWTQILESFNNVPRIAKKVRILDFDKIRRKNLSSFRPFIEKENPNKNCFICDEEIKENPPIDHVIPWSFIFSDDLWNLVYVHTSCNSSKSNTIPTSKMIKKLEIRNLKLYDLLITSQELNTKKPFKELELAIERDYVQKFWIQCKT